jgi:hypothetical protein
MRTMRNLLFAVVKGVYLGGTVVRKQTGDFLGVSAKLMMLSVMVAQTSDISTAHHLPCLSSYSPNNRSYLLASYPKAKRWRQYEIWWISISGCGNGRR